MQASELNELSLEDLQHKLAEAREERFKLRFRSANEAIEKHHEFKNWRREIARIETILRQRRAAAEAK